MADLSLLSTGVEQVIRSSEVRAVAKLIGSGKLVRLGQVVDYFIELDFETPPNNYAGLTLHRKRSSYRVAVEPWHLEAAERMLSQPQQK